jgi:hypothetical protein
MFKQAKIFMVIISQLKAGSIRFLAVEARFNQMKMHWSLPRSILVVQPTERLALANEGSSGTGEAGVLGFSGVSARFIW